MLSLPGFWVCLMRSVYETVAGFDLALLYDLINSSLNEKIEDNAHQLVKQLAAFRNLLKPRG